MDRSDAGWELEDATDLGQPVTVSEFDGIRLPLRESGAAVERQGRGACKAGCLCFVKHRGGDGGRLTRAGKLVGRVGQADCAPWGAKRTVGGQAGVEDGPAGGEDEGVRAHLVRQLGACPLSAGSG